MGWGVVFDSACEQARRAERDMLGRALDWGGVCGESGDCPWRLPTTSEP